MEDFQEIIDLFDLKKEEEETYQAPFTEINFEEWVPCNKRWEPDVLFLEGFLELTTEQAIAEVQKYYKTRWGYTEPSENLLIREIKHEMREMYRPTDLERVFTRSIKEWNHRKI